MERYFTKYLPVEGEIEEGDMFIGSDGRVYQRTNWQLGWQSKEARRAKLFLCSRDIQTGDIIKTHGPNNSFVDGEYVGVSHYHKDRYVVKGNGVIMSIKKEAAYKVIGEVSPEAVWVTEGMEFDEDQVRGAYIASFTEPKIVYEIMCPICKHFQ